MVVFNVVWSDAVNDDAYSELRAYDTFIRLFGRTADGRSVFVQVEGFRCYFYVQLPYDLSQPHKYGSGYAERWRDALVAELRADHRWLRPEHASVQWRVRMDGFCNGVKGPYVRLTCSSRGSAIGLQRTLQRGVRGPDQSVRRLPLYETQVDPLMRFFHDRGLRPSGWVSIPDRHLEAAPFAATNCHREYRAQWSAVHPHELADLPPLRMASFDIECASEDGSFPDAEREGDRVIQIGTTLQVYGDAEPYRRHLITLGDCEPIEGVDVVACATEEEVLLSFKRLVCEEDVDAILGWNIFKFDFAFMVARARRAGVLGEFATIGRMAERECAVERKTLSSQAYGHQEFEYLNTIGRLQIDVLPVLKKETKFESYRLDAVAERVLGERKLDLPPKELFELYRQGGAANMRRIGEYCVQDTRLPLRIALKLCTIPNLFAMSQVACVPIPDLILRGQQIKVFSQIVGACTAAGYVVHAPDKTEEPDTEKFQGATVLEPVSGAYFDPVTVMDFASLYPSIMLAHNLCHSTICWEWELDRHGNRVRPNPFASLEGAEYTPWFGSEAAPAGRCRFVQWDEAHPERRGMLPTILDHLLAARRRSKKDMKAAPDEHMRAVHNGKQLAYKVSCNSVYGFTGAVKGGMLPLKEVAAAVTWFGREMIEQSKRYAEEHYPGSRVVYGDTDSIMVQFRLPDGSAPTVEQSFRMGEECSAAITATFRKPNELEMEKVYWPWFLWKKKRYAGQIWNRPEAPDGLDAKGIQVVRRDNCPLVRETCQAVLDRLLVQRDVPGAKDLARQAVADLLQGRVPIDRLIVSKTLSVGYDESTAPPAHVAVYRKRLERDPNDQVVSGDRVPYVFVRPDCTERTARDLKQGDRADDPDHVRRHDLPIDYAFYFEHQLRGPLDTLFELIEADPASIYADEQRAGYNRLRGQRDLVAMWGGSAAKRAPAKPAPKRPKREQTTLKF